MLVVDDDDGVRDYLRVSLSLDGWDVVAAASGEEALERLAVVEPDVIVLDHDMPGMSGLDCAKRITELGSRAALVMFSGSLDASLAVALRELGVAGVVKPDRAALFALLGRLHASALAQRTGRGHVR